MNRDLAKGRLSHSLLGFLKLLTSGVLGAGGLALIASNRTNILASSNIVLLLIFIQWQTFGLTVAKMGVEQVVFAAVSRNQDLYFSLRELLLKKVLPLALIFSGMAFWRFSPMACVGMFASILLDAYSLIVISDFNARSRYNDSSLANLLNYPLFFLILIGLRLFQDLGVPEIIGAFLISSALRASWVAWRRIRPPCVKPVVLSEVHKVGIQQVLNYFLFRADQLFLGLVCFHSPTLFGDNAFLAMYLFLAKLPELASGVINVVGTVVLPKLKLVEQSDFDSMLAIALRNWASLLTSALGGALCMVVYQGLWIGPSIAWTVAVPFTINTVLIFPVNALTYMMITQGYMSGLLRNLFVTCAMGLVVLATLSLANWRSSLGWVVPMQQGVFLALALMFGWGKRRSIYV